MTELLTLGEWREKWSPQNRPEGKSWFCQWIGFVVHCSEASVLIHPERQPSKKSEQRWTYLRFNVATRSTPVNESS